MEPTTLPADLTSLLRSGMHIVVGLLVAHGAIASTQSAMYESFGGAGLLFAVSQGWSWWRNRRIAKHIDVAKALAPSSPNTPGVPA